MDIRLIFRTFRAELQGLTKFSNSDELLDSRWQRDSWPQGRRKRCQNVPVRGGKSERASFPENFLEG